MTSRQRSYLLPGLTAEDRKLLAGVPRKATLAEEIAFLRLRIGKLAAGDDGSDRILVRMLELLTRMVSVQAKLDDSEGDDLSELNELVRRRLMAAGFPDPEADPTAAVRLLAEAD
jgi:hypothetical protein